MIYLGIDVGTTSSKATAIDQNGTVRAQAHGEYPVSRNSQGYAEIDPRAVWDTVKMVIASAAAQTGDAIKAIAIASFGESFVALDKHGKVLGNSILYSDIRGTDEIKDILSSFEEQTLYSITGMPVNSMYTLNKLLWVKKHEPDKYSKIDKLFLFGDYIYYMLSGERCIDYSLASRTQFFDVMNHCWADQVLKTFDIGIAMLSAPVAPGSVIGKVSAGIAAELNLPSGVLLIAGAHDQVCAALGSGVLAKGECVDGIGTSECITALINGLDQREFMRKNNFCIEPYAIAGEYVTLAFNSSGASSLGWFCEQFVKPQGVPSTQTVFDLIEAECPVGPTNLLVLPHFAGSGTPHMDPYSTGAVLGLRLNTSRGDIYKAIIEGLCFEMLFNAELLKSVGTSITSITCVGGGSRSDILLQVKADIMGIPVKRLIQKESGTMALAMLCAAACNDVSGLEEAARLMVRTDKIFEPNPYDHQLYLERFNTYKKIYTSLLNLK